MTNPYSVPNSDIASSAAVEKQKNGALRWFATAASILAIGVLLIIASILIPQAMRLDSENASLPPGLKGAAPSAVSASWIGGIVAACGALANVVGLFLIRARKTVLPLTILAISVACMVAVAVMFKPT